MNRRPLGLWELMWLWPIAGLLGCQTLGGGRGAASSNEEVWAIRCITLRTPDRFERANSYAEALKKVAGLKPDLVQILSDDDGTAVYYGRYRREYRAEGGEERFIPNQLPDLETIRGLRFQGADVWPFILASMDLLPTYRSPHPEWNLATADGYWSLHVAVFYNTDTMQSRRAVAEEYCTLLREQGEDAYYHHGSVNSSVYIGTYPENAVVEMRREQPLRGTTDTTFRIVDPRMAEAQKRFPVSLHNGFTANEVIRDPATGEVKQRVPAPSFPVLMPKAQRQRSQAGGR